jgi:hypothetical protein
LKLIDVRDLQSVEEIEHQFVVECFDVDLAGNKRDDGFDSDADSKNSHHSSEEEITATELTREDCEMKNNDILKVQLIVQLYLYDQSTSPLRFNKVNDGTGEVNKVAALQILQYWTLRKL